MFLEKHSRFIRQYSLSIGARRLSAPVLPFIDHEDRPSLLDALKTAIIKEQAFDVRPNGDIIELMNAEHDKSNNAVVLLFHRAAPNAADPVYRKKARASIKLRAIEKEPGEDQSVSCHMVIDLKNPKGNCYNCGLEEIPGLSMSIIQSVIKHALREYSFTYEDEYGDEQVTYSTFKPVGIKTESVTNALKTGKLGMITLVRPAKAGFVDSSDIFHPQEERMTIRVSGRVEPKDWMDQVGRLARGARKDGWEDVQIEIETDDDRSKTIKISRSEEAKEILFVRSHQLDLATPHGVCSIKASDELVQKTLEAIR